MLNLKSIALYQDFENVFVKEQKRIDELFNSIFEEIISIFFKVKKQKLIVDGEIYDEEEEYLEPDIEQVNLYVERDNDEHRIMLLEKISEADRLLQYDFISEYVTTNISYIEDSYELVNNYDYRTFIDQCTSKCTNEKYAKFFYKIHDFISDCRNARSEWISSSDDC